MTEILHDRVRQLHGMSLDEYKRARRAGSLPSVPGSAALEVFSGEAANEDTSRG
jgi:hypothetical protein